MRVYEIISGDREHLVKAQVVSTHWGYSSYECLITFIGINRKDKIGLDLYLDTIWMVFVDQIEQKVEDLF